MSVAQGMYQISLLNQGESTRNIYYRQVLLPAIEAEAKQGRFSYTTSIPDTVDRAILCNCLSYDGFDYSITYGDSTKLIVDWDMS